MNGYATESSVFSQCWWSANHYGLEIDWLSMVETPIDIGILLSRTEAACDCQNTYDEAKASRGKIRPAQLSVSAKKWLCFTSSELQSDIVRATSCTEQVLQFGLSQYIVWLQVISLSCELADFDDSGNGAFAVVSQATRLNYRYTFNSLECVPTRMSIFSASIYGSLLYKPNFRCT